MRARAADSVGRLIDPATHPCPDMDTTQTQAEAADLRRQVEELTRRNDELSKQLAKQSPQPQQQAAGAAGEGTK